MPDDASVVMIGDRMQFSVELLQQFLETIDQRSPLVVVKAIHVQSDGSKLLVLSRVDDVDGAHV